MENDRSQKVRFAKLILLVLFLVTIISWLAVFSVKPNTLKVIACDVGQGDAILVTYGNYQLLTDGGPPNGKVVDCLSTHMPFWDRTIEVVVNTHPQLDHYGGLIEVFKRYRVEKFISNELDSSSQEYQVLKAEVLGSGVDVINPDMGLSIRYNMIHLDILHPSKSFAASNSVPKNKNQYGLAESGSDVLGVTTSSLDPNEFSIVTALHYGGFDALFTGDSGPDINDQIAQILDNDREISWEYIKIPHHGSKNGITENLLNVLNNNIQNSGPIAVISAGKNNRYGHPHTEVIKLLHDKAITLLRTDEVGDIIVETDGQNYWIDN